MAYDIPPVAVGIRELARRGLIRGAVEPLESFGFAGARVATGTTHVEMAIRAAGAVLDETGTAPEEVDLVLYATALAASAVVPGSPQSAGSVLHLTTLEEMFRYPAAVLQHELDLANATVAGLDQQACASMFSAMQLGRAMLLADPDVRTVLCVSSDRLPDGARRDLVYNLISDGACAAVLRRDTPRNTILACHQVTKGTLWDAASLEAELIAAYFPTAVAVIEAALHKAHLTLDDIDWIVPHNVSLRSWEILLGMLRVPVAKLLASNIARVGHTMAADNFINLRDAQDAGILRRGDRLLLFTFGFGLNWSCMVVEH